MKKAKADPKKVLELARYIAPHFGKVCRMSDVAFHAAHVLAEKLLEEEYRQTAEKAVERPLMEAELKHLECCGNCENAFACTKAFEAVESGGPVGAGYWCDEWERRDFMNKIWDDQEEEENDDE